MQFEIETDVPIVPLQPSDFLTAFLCRHKRKGTAIETRKFIAQCGTKIIVETGIRGQIVSMEPEDPCKAGESCPQCKDQIDKIAILIANGK
jgi:hypothetical protein